MRHLTHDRFINKLNCIIPNLESKLGIRQEFENIGDEITIIKFFKNDLLVFKIGIECPNWLSSSRAYITTLELNRDYLKEQGIIINNSGSEAINVLDSLYHTCNPLKKTYSELTPTQRSKWNKDFRIRFTKYQSYYNGYTKKLLNELITYIEIQHNIAKPIDTTDLEVVNEYYNQVISNLPDELRSINYQFEYDCITHEWFISNYLFKYKYKSDTKSFVFYTSHRESFTVKYNISLHPSGMRDFYYNHNKFVVIDDEVIDKTRVKLVKCSCCGTETLDAYVIPDIGCNRCLKDYGKIHSYSTRVPSILTFKASKINYKQEPLYLGIELEYNSHTKTKDAQLSHKLLSDHAILKSDGSVPNGFEIVTCPATADIHLAQFKPFFAYKDSHTKLYPDTNTGMHIHLSRKALGQFSIGKMIAFFNNAKNKSKLEKIGGRKLNNYCQQDDSRTFTYEIYNGKDGARYNILNCNNDATVEIRMFATPKSYEEFASRVEFADAIGRYCMPATQSLSLKDLIKFDNFKVFVTKNRKAYPNLSNVLKSL